MKPKQIIRLITDAAMTMALLFLMGYQFWGDTPHEWVGAGMFALFIAHHLLNWSWWKGLLRNRYTPLRTLTLAIDLATFFAMAGLMISGVMLSRTVFAFLPIRGGLHFARLLHLSSSYWGFVLMALHLGLHWGLILGMAKKAAGLQKPSRKRAALLNIAGAAVALYGLLAFLRRDILSYMLLLTQFAFMDPGESKLIFYLDYTAIMGLFIHLAHRGAKLLRPGAPPPRPRRA